jgi:BlaR1 peptidase M56
MIDLGAAQGWLADVARVATGGLMSAVWQGLLLAAVAGLGLRLLPRTPAAVRFAIWFAVFLVVTGLPVISLWSHGAGSMQTGGRGAWLTLDSRWSVAIAAVWVAASLVRAATLVGAALRVRTLWKRAKPVSVDFEDASVLHPTRRDTAAMDGTPGVLSVTRRAQICTSDEVDRPTVIGFFAPKILIPTWLLEKLTAAELEQIVLHESGHLGRADDWMNLLQKIALVVFPLNPALAWVERRLCFERELACDERVLRVTHAPKAYAACLATLAEHRLGRRGLALALGALGRESELGRRVGRILRRGETMRPAHAKLVLGGAMLGLLAGAVGLERCPQMVGFASAGAGTVAHSDQRRAENNNEIAIARPTVIQVNQGRSLHEYNEIRSIANVPHETMLMASEPSSREVPATATVREVRDVGYGRVAGLARMVRTAESNPESQHRSRLVSDVDRSPSAEGVIQWFVVTSWQSQDGSHMVLTTAGTTNNQVGSADQKPGADNGSPDIEQVHPYAAVPVRGGWLVFQL